MTTLSKEQKKVHRRLPLFQGILPINWHFVPAEIMAGLTLAALGIPEVMGYTKIAGTPVITGLYTLLLPVLVFAIFGSSRHLVVGADSATAAIMAAGLVGLAAQDTPQYVALAGALAIIAAIFLIFARLIWLGFLANFSGEVRPYRVPDGCRHPGCPGTGGRNAWGAAIWQRDDPEIRKCASTDTTSQYSDGHYFTGGSAYHNHQFED